jgi:hypothetical protein
MRRDQIDFTTETNSNKDHANYGKTSYHAMMRRPFPEGTENAGAALGRSFVSYEVAYEDLRHRVKAESGVDIGPLRDISANDVFLAVHRALRWFDDHGETDGCEASALEDIREVHDLLVEHRRREHEAQEARLRSARQVWMRRYTVEFTHVEFDDTREFESLDELMETALIHSDDGVMGWEHIESGKPWVTEITTVDGAPVWSPPEGTPDYPPFEEE